MRQEKLVKTMSGTKAMKNPASTDQSAWLTQLRTDRPFLCQYGK